MRLILHRKQSKELFYIKGLFYTTLNSSSACFVLKAKILFKYEEFNLLNHSGNDMYHLL